MKVEYRSIDTSTLAGLKAAEALKACGWTIYSVGLYLIRFYRRGK